MNPCINCPEGEIPIPDDHIYYTGKDFSQFGIKKYMSLKSVLDILLPIFESVMANKAGGSLSASEVVAEAPPQFLSNGYSPCWQKLSTKTGRYQVTVDGDAAVFSYNIDDAIAKLPSDISVNSIDVQINVVGANGETKVLSNSKKASNGFSIDKSMYPVTAVIKINAGSDACQGLRMEKVIYASYEEGSIDRSFVFDVIGVNGDKLPAYTQKDINSMVLQSLNNISNIVNDLRAGGYADTVNRLSAETARIKKDLLEPVYYLIGTGSGQKRMTEEQVFNYLDTQIAGIRQQIAAIEASRSAAGV